MAIQIENYSKIKGLNLIILMVALVVSMIILCVIYYNLDNIHIINSGPKFSSIQREQPQTDVGSYMVYQSLQTIKNNVPVRDVFIYWKEINEPNLYDTSFEYYITCTPKLAYNSNINIPPQRSSKNNVRFKNLSTRIEYIFLIHPANEYGISSNYSIINVPTEQERNKIKNLYLTKISIDQNITGVSWNINNKELNHNYTIFWCEINPDLPYECLDSINWIHILGSTSAYFHNVDNHTKTYNYAISENWEVENDSKVTMKSSGMIFKSCGIMVNNTLDRIDFIFIDFITSTSVELYWIFKCSYTVDEFIGYEVEYCTTVSKYSFQCQEPSVKEYIDIETQNEKNSDYNITMYEDITDLVIGGLQPNTTYKFTIYTKSYIGLGKPTKPILLTTQK